jgi:diguanylate cyclase (GGDEF)-like protein
MASPAVLSPVRSTRRNIDVAAWGDPAKVLLSSGLLLPFGLLWLVRMFQVEADPSASPYISRSFVPVMKAFLAFQAAGHAALVFFALALRRRRTVPWLVEAEVQLWFVCTAFSIYAVGHFTSAMGVMFLVLPVVGYLLFEAPVMNRGLATGVTLTVLGVALPLAGVVPYSPFLSRAPWADGRVELGWLVSQGVPLAFATVVGLSLYLSLLRAYRARQVELERLSSTDELTSLFNRRIFFARLEEELARAQRHGLPVSVVLLDVDHFKAINDAHGHLAGDEVLRRLSRVVRESLRVMGVAARYGGEEFALLLPHTTLEGARVVAQRLLVAARSVPFGPTGTLTVSLGVAEWRAPEASDALVARTDAALYEAKRSGRDRACEAPAPAAASS